MNYPIQRLIVFNNTPGVTHVYWDLDPKFHDTGTYSYQLQINRTSNQDDPDWSNVGNPVTGSFYITDSENQVTSYNLDKYYRILLTTDQGTYRSPIEGCFGQLSRAEWKTANEITRQETLRHDIVSVPGVLLKRRTTGAYCPHCTDNSGGCTNSSCKYCYGTGYYGGYYNPVKFHMMDVSPSQQREIHYSNNAATFNMSVNAYKGRALGIPELNKDDIWVDITTSQRFKIVASQVIAQIRRVPLVRAVELTLLPTSDIAYDIPTGNPNESSEKEIETEGCGDKRVDHTYAATTQDPYPLQYVYSDGNPVVGATISIYPITNSIVSTTSVFTTTTDANGFWNKAFMADVGSSYQIKFQKPGICGPDTANIRIDASELTTEESEKRQEETTVTSNTKYTQSFW